MQHYRPHSFFLLVFSSLSVAFILAVLPWPEALRALKPNFVLLGLIFLLTRFPEVVGAGGAWWLGLIYDAVIGCPLGVHALSFTLIAALVLMNYARWRLIPLSQQILVAFLFAILEQTLVASGQRML